nr:uncharacterized protein LOC106841047 isoform X3 [Equus asinus]
MVPDPRRLNFVRPGPCRRRRGPWAWLSCSPQDTEQGPCAGSGWGTVVGSRLGKPSPAPPSLLHLLQAHLSLAPPTCSLWNDPAIFGSGGHLLHHPVAGQVTGSLVLRPCCLCVWPAHQPLGASAIHRNQEDEVAVGDIFPVSSAFSPGFCIRHRLQVATSSCCSLSPVVLCAQCRATCEVGLLHSSPHQPSSAIVL